jgi:hypothetical protein
MAEIEQGQDGRAQELRNEADKELAFMPAPSRYAAKAMELNRENAKFILKLRAPGVGPYVRELYDTLRSLNPVHYIPEKLTALWSGKEPVLGNKVDRKQTAEELAVYAAFMGLGKALDVGMGELKGYLFPDGIAPTAVPPAWDAPDVKPTSLPNAETAVDGGATESPGAKPVANEELPTKLPGDRTAYKQNPSSVVLSSKVEPGTYVYVQDPQGVVHVVPNYSHMHPTVLGGFKPAAGAGTLTINEDGIVVEIDNTSGTFKFGPETLPRVKAAIERQGLKVTPDAIHPFDWEDDR